MVDSDLFDHDMDLELLELETTSNQQNNQDDGFEDDDLDLDQLVEVAETIEQQRAVSNGNISFVSTEEDSMPPPPLPENTPNFHPIHSENLRTWIYPTNYPIRGYQLNIVQKAMFNNTLVALPTGLGKTFIAAVVMFNYWRWFPNSKIIFMAPTRPLVEQQIEACFTICGLPQEETVEMTGSISPAKRRDLWQSKRVFFATPQTIQKDIETHACPIEKIACIVVDEAHKATGNYAYTEVVRKLYKKNKQFRILALTATPGGGIDTVQKVIENLHITNIQIRTEDSMDIREFSYGKNVQNIVVKLGYTEGSTGILPRIVDDYRNKVFLPILVDLSKKPINVQPDIERASPYGLRSTRMRFQAEARNFDARFKFSIIAQMLVAESASRAHDLLCQHGVVPFLESIESTLEEFKKKPKMNKAEIALCNNSALNAMIRNVKQEVVKPDFIGHPKLDRLIAILLSHFSGIPQNETSKVMIFSSYRSSVVEICKVLDRHRPMIRSSFFVGQSTDKHGTKGLRQSEQQQVIQKFKRDEFNVLVSTSIGEEGLDIGEVDLIVCYDSQTSPIRMLQRMGRTGRKRKGKCILLMTEAEEKKFAQAKESYARVQNMISRGGILTYYKPNPTVLPPNYRPALCRKTLTVATYQPKVVSSRKRKKEVAEDSYYDREGLLKPEAELNFVRSFCDQDHNFTSMEQVISRYWPVQKTLLCLNKYVPLQARAKPTFRVGHSNRTSQLISLVQKCEHRILHPEEKIDFQLEPRKRQQTKLNLPRKSTANTTKKKAHDRRNSNISTAIEDEDFAEFMANNDVSHFIDTASNGIQEFFLPPKKKPVAPVAAPQPTVSKMPRFKEKGKSKEIPFVNPSKDDLFDFGEDFEDQDREPSWEPILPDSCDENITPFIDPHHQQNGESSTSVSNPKTFDSPKDIDQSWADSLALPSSPTAAPQLPSSTPPLAEATYDDMDQDSEEFFDFPMDDAFLAQTDALIASKTLACFDEAIEPMFPFENPVSNQPVKAIAFTWAHTVPSFSDKAMKLLEKRQSDIKELTGQFVPMHYFPQFKFTRQQQSNEIVKPAQRDDCISMDSVLEQTAVVDQQINNFPQKRTEVINIDESQPISYKDDITTADAVTNDDEDDDFGFSEGALASFLENKFEQEGDESHVFPYFMFGPEVAPSQPQIISKSFLYADKSSTATAVIQKEEEEDEGDDEKSFEYIFSQEQDYISSQESSSSRKVVEEVKQLEQDTNESRQGEQEQVELEKEKQDTRIEQVEQDTVELEQGDQESKPIRAFVKHDFYSNANKEEDRQPQLPESDNDAISLDLDNEELYADDLFDTVEKITVTKTASAKEEIPDSIDKLTVMIDKDECEIDEAITVGNQVQNQQKKDDGIALPSIDAVETEEITDQDHHSTISIQSNLTEESPVVHFRSIKKFKAITSEDEQERPEASPNRDPQSPSLLNQLSKGLYTPSPLRIQNSDNDESPIQLFRKRKLNRKIQDEDEDEVVLISEHRQKKRRLKRKPTTPIQLRPNPTILEEDEEELLPAPPSRNDLLNRLKQSSYGVHGQRRAHRHQYSNEDALENPFIDAEAEFSSDEGHTDDEDMDDQESCMNSFINDNSSLGQMESNQRSVDEEESEEKNVNIYAESLHRDENPMHEKHWLNRFNVEKWLDQREEDQVIDDTDEESIQEFSSDLHRLAHNNMNDDDTLDDDFM